MEPVSKKDVRTVMNVTDLTADELARITKLNPATVCLTLKGDRRSKKTIEKIASAIGNHVAEQIKTALLPVEN